MRRLIALGGAALVALALPAMGVAKDEGKRAKVYRATLTANDAATAAGVPDVRGKAQLVDGRKRDKASVHVKGLVAGDSYLWHVHKAPAGTEDPCANPGPPDPAFPWAEDASVVANEDGIVNAKSRTTTFQVDPDAVYSVNVHLADGTVIACGVLERKRAKQPKGDDDTSSKREQAQGRGKGRGRKDHGDN